MIESIALQSEFSQVLPEVVGNVDYTIFRENLERIDEIIQLTELEQKMIKFVLADAQVAKNAQAKEGEKSAGRSRKQQQRIAQMACEALRCTIARHLVDESFRRFSCHLAESALLQRFCRLDRFVKIKVPAKSTLQRYEQMVSEAQVRELVVQLIQTAAEPVAVLGEESQKLQWMEAICLESVYLDCACLKANIHYPVDWVLLRDATRTLMKATLLIRKQGLKHRMDPPQSFLSQMNRLCMEMTHARRQKDSKRTRKRIFRLMKKLMKRIRGHGQKHVEMLEENWEQTDLSYGQMQQITARIKNILGKLPAAISQAHKRIISEIQVKNEEKILSLYEEDMHVIKRGKAGAEIEFGNTLLLAEQSDGVIIDWKVYQDQAPAEPHLVPESLERMSHEYGQKQLKDLATDRGFQSEKNDEMLEAEEIFNAMCPRDPGQFQQRLSDNQFRAHQKRRAQTEARIAIFQNNFVGSPLRSKGFHRRELQVSWAVLAHNLWVLARLPRVETEQKKQVA